MRPGLSASEFVNPKLRIYRTTMAISSSFQSAQILVSRALSEASGAFLRSLTALTGRSRYIPDRIIFAPSDLRIGDSIQGRELLAGRFAFAGSVVEITDSNPFETRQQNVGWQSELHGFSWLSHVLAADDQEKSATVRGYISSWMSTYNRGYRGVGVDSEVMAKRIISWLRHSPTILNGADGEFYSDFMTSLGLQIRHLARESRSVGLGLPRLYTQIALCYVSLCCNNQRKRFSDSHVRLSQELDLQILPDGGHISRNPSVLIEVLEYLLPLKFAFIAAGTNPPAGILNAIERIYPAIRFFRLSDGSIARFNGVRTNDIGLLGALMRHDETQGNPVAFAGNSGFQRLQMNDSIAIMDVGNMPRGSVSRHSHAGCLSFEFSSAGENLVVNCGAPENFQGDAPAVWRSTAAHSTAGLENHSQCRFEGFDKNAILHNGIVLTPDMRVETSRKDSEHGTSVVAAHLGYASEFRLRHQRSLTLDSQGKRLRGTDWFTDPKKGALSNANDLRIKIRFHLFPSVQAVQDLENTNIVLLKTRQNQQWRFEAEGATASIEESIFFTSPAGPSYTKQIVLTVSPEQSLEIRWSLLRQD